MSDSVIKGLATPHCCLECSMFNPIYYGGECKFLGGFAFDEFAFGEERHPDCPLLPLPDGYGDLIDKKKALEAIIKTLGIRDKRYLLQTEKKIYKVIEKQPVIVEAEGE